MLIDSEKIKQTKEQIEVMQAFIDGKEIEFKERFKKKDNYRTANAPNWDFLNFEYRIKHLEPKYDYPIYKKLKDHTETVVKFHSIDAGMYISVQKDSIYKPGDIASNMAPHTDSVLEDCDYSRLPKFHTCSRDELVEHGIELPNYILNQLDEFEIERLKRKKTKLSEDTIELFEVMVYCDIMKEFMIKQVLYSDEELENYRNSIKTGRSFIMYKNTKQIIKVNYN
jgi:hypothetical protein